MSEIHWFAWVSIGLFVAITSALVGGNVLWFGWLGLIFIIIGISKLVYVFVFSEKQKPLQQGRTAPHPKFHCPRCGSIVHSYDFYCRRCGSRLR